MFINGPFFLLEIRHAIPYHNVSSVRRLHALCTALHFAALKQSSSQVEEIALFFTLGILPVTTLTSEQTPGRVQHPQQLTDGRTVSSWCASLWGGRRRVKSLPIQRTISVFDVRYSAWHTRAYTVLAKRLVTQFFDYSLFLFQQI